MEGQHIGRRIQEARKKAGLNQTELADKMSVTANTISNWERNTNSMDVEKLRDLSDALGISPNEILGIGLPDTEAEEELIYHYRNNPRFKDAVDNLIEMMKY